MLLSCVIGAFVLRPGKTGENNVAKSGKIVLKLAHGLDESHPVHLAMLDMKARLERYTKGAATLDIYSGGVLGNEVDCMEQVQKGTLAMTKVSTAALEVFLPEMKIFSIPFLFHSEEHSIRVLHGDFGKKMLNVGIKNNFLGLCYYDSGDRNFYTTKKPIHNAADVAGMKVRVMNSRVAMDMINAMKGSPCPISWGELYTALAQGTVDAAENNWPSFVTSRHFEVCKYFISSSHQRIPDIVIISKKSWDSLPVEVQQALRKAAEESETYQRELWKKKTVECIAFSKKKGVEIITPDMDSFRKACAPILQDKDYANLLPLVKIVQEIQ